MGVDAGLRLLGLRIVVTRAAHQAEPLSRLLRQNGATVILLPAIAIAPPSNVGPLKAAAARVSQYDWVVFTSSNAVGAFMSELNMAGRPEPMPLIATIGSGTKASAEALGLTVTVVPSQSDSESLAQAFPGRALAGKRILLPCAALTRGVLPMLMRHQGGVVDVVDAYQNVVPPETIQKAPAVFQPPLPDWVTFASASAVQHLVELIGDSLKAVRIATIGRVTSAAVYRCGLSVQAEAESQTIESLVSALIFARSL